MISTTLYSTVLRFHLADLSDRFLGSMATCTNPSELESMANEELERRGAAASVHSLKLGSRLLASTKTIVCRPVRAGILHVCAHALKSGYSMDLDQDTYSRLGME
jgi:hypothetical protein